MINTKEVKERRDLSFTHLEDILADVEAVNGDAIRATGNWTPAQIVQHVAKLIEFSIDGFPASAPWPLRILGRLMKRRALTQSLTPGFKLPMKFDFLVPDGEAAWSQATHELREAVGRARDGRMTRPSPILGRMSHEDWIKLHCRHAEMHFGFMHPGR